MIEYVSHVLPLEDFDEFASGYGSAEAVRRLGEPEESIRRALVTEIMEIARSFGPDSPLAEAVAGISRLDETSPGSLATVLADPYVRVWAVKALTASEEGNLDPAHFARLAEIAASAALLAGEQARLPLHVVDGFVQLPTIGALRLEGAASDWLPRRRLTAGPLSVAIEDTDPYRDCFARPVTGRLSPEDADIWRERFADAVGYLESALPDYLPGLSAGLSTLTPLIKPASGDDVSGAARDAYGAIGLALPADGPTLALLLIHEFQHVKLGALLDLFDFYDPDDCRRFYAPWRADPRPLGGLYQGTYAHIAVTEYWRVRRRDVPAASRAAAEANFVRWRTQTAEAVNVLLESGALTPHGERFARAMGETLAPWLEEPVGTEATHAARRAAADHRAAWVAPPRD